ncbi:MAG: hypothetical protein WDM96_06210 [Lacunisphaera sp.]
MPSAFIALNDDFYTGAIIYWATVLAVIAMLVVAYRKIATQADETIRRRGRYAGAALVIILAAVCFVASDRITTYRVLFALGGVILVLAVYGLRALVVAKKMRPKHYAGLVVIGTFFAFLAHRNSFLLLAEPQAGRVGTDARRSPARGGSPGPSGCTSSPRGWPTG